MNKGSITISILMLVSVFIIVIFGVALYIAIQLDGINRQSASNTALNIAEAGANYYRWHLAHAPTDYKDGQSGNGPYVHTYKDFEGNTLGQYSLQISSPSAGSKIITITSTGWKSDYPNTKRTVTVQYGIPSLAQYAFLTNASSWYGSGITINGQIHSNAGIRMDGINNSLVTSAVSTYTCGTETGCSPSQTKPAVWGAGGPSSLWQFPVPQIDFAAISIDFASMKTAAQSSGLYLAPSNSFGYHIVFINSGTFQVYKVTRTSSVNGYSVENGCQSLNQTITNQTLLGTYSVSQKPIIFAEDYLWVDGVVKGRTSVVAAKFPIASNSMNIWITNNLTYAARDATNSLGLIAQNDIYFGLNTPTSFEVDAALLAQNGKIIRHGYAISGCSSYANAVLNKLTLYGALISYTKSYWNFGSPPVSGYTNRDITYDPNLKFIPPPYFPTNGTYQPISWTEN